MLCDNLERWDGVGLGREFQREGTYIYLWLTCVVVWQKLTQCYNYPPLKINLKGTCELAFCR